MLLLQKNCLNTSRKEVFLLFLNEQRNALESQKKRFGGKLDLVSYNGVNTNQRENGKKSY